MKKLKVHIKGKGHLTACGRLQGDVGDVAGTLLTALQLAEAKDKDVCRECIEIGH